jgi:hypothetical protein
MEHHRPPSSARHAAPAPDVCPARVFGDGTSRDCEPQPGQLGLDLSLAPQVVLQGHTSNERSELAPDRAPTMLSPQPGPPAPKGLPALPAPTQHRLGASLSASGMPGYRSDDQHSSTLAEAADAERPVAGPADIGFRQTKLTAIERDSCRPPPPIETPISPAPYLLTESLAASPIRRKPLVRNYCALQWGSAGPRPTRDRLSMSAGGESEMA